MNNTMTAFAWVTSYQKEQAHSPAGTRPTTNEALSVLEGVNMNPETVSEALNSLELVTARLYERGDARAVFPDVYAVITRRVKATIEGSRGPGFLEPSWISNLAGLFCQYYLRALSASLAASPQASAAWTIAFQSGDAGEGAAAIDALLGINAHINFDLAQGLYDNIVAHRAVKNPRLLGRYQHDHDLVNAILAGAMPEILSVLTRRYRCPLSAAATRTRGLEDAASRVVMFALRHWRARVWGDLVEMLEAREPGRLAAVHARMDRTSARIGRVIAIWGSAMAVARPRRRAPARLVPLAA